MRHSQTIRCVVKTAYHMPHLRIKTVGGVNPDGSRWRQSQERTVKEIEDGTWEFFAQSNWRRDRVVVGIYNGLKYLKGLEDESQPETLLALPECL